jgi:two-component system, cell cycle sensor histidine kinase and response regulator CckA
MPHSPDLYSFEREYGVVLGDYLTGARPVAPRDLGTRLRRAELSPAALCRLHHRVLAQMQAASGVEETALRHAETFLVEALTAYDAAPDRLHEETFRQIFENNPLPMWIYEEDSLRFLNVNRAAVEKYGFTREEFLARTILDIRPESDWGPVRRQIASRHGDQPARGEWRHRLKDGRLIDVEITSRKFVFAGCQGRLVVVSDITERKAHEERLRLLESAIANASDIVLITEAGRNDPPGPRIVYVNDAFERITGYSRAEAVGQTPRILQGPGTSPETRARIRQALHDWEPVTVEILNYRKDGTGFWAELSIQPIADPTGWVTHWLAIQRDVTERRREQERLRQAQKMEVVGQLTSGIAHNFNNLLTVIQGNAELIGRASGLPETLARKKTSILTAARQGAELVRQLMVISRGSAGNSHPREVNPLVAETGQMMERILPANIGFSLELADEPLWSDLDAGEFSQSLLNLIVNARDAMPDGGKLTISTGYRAMTEADFERPSVFFLSNCPPRAGMFVCVTVGDTGIGMNEETRRRIFEPFFTTKGSGKGTGLGLATTLGFVSERGGCIEVESEPGRGTVFRLGLPASRPATDPPVARTFHSGVFPALTALVAEDNSDVCRLIAAILEEKGFTVLTARDGAEAIRVASEYQGPIQLVVTDKAMPSLYGDSVIRLITQLRPECRFILTSGSTVTDDEMKALSTRARFLQKPFGRNELIDAILNLMRGATGETTG